MRIIIIISAFFFILPCVNAQKIDSIKILGATDFPANHIRVFFKTSNFYDIHDRFTIDSTNGFLDLRFYWNTCGIFLPATWQYDTLIAIPTTFIGNMNLAIRTYLDSNTVDSNCLFLNMPSRADSFFIFPQAVSGYTLENKFTIYPNPSQNSIHIEGLEDLHVVEAMLYNFLGQHANIDFINNEIDISHLPNGLYLLHLSTNKGVLTKKIMIGR